MTANTESGPLSPEIEPQYTPVEVAALTKKDVRTVRGWFRDGKIDGAKRIHNQWYVSKTDLATFLSGENA